MKKINLISLFSLLSLSVLAPFTSLAAGGALIDGFDIVKGFRGAAGVRDFASPQDFIFQSLKLVLGFLSIVAVIAIIIGGVMYITAGGDEKKTERAKHVILYTVIGLVLIGVSGIIVNVLIAFFFS